MASLSQLTFRSPLFLRLYEKRIHGRFLSTFAKEPMNYTTLFDDLQRMGRAEPAPQEPARVLDLGCGTGWYARHLAGLDRYRRARITGVDLSQWAVEVARTNAARLPGPHAGLDFRTGDVQALGPELTGPVDEIWLCGCLHQMSDPRAALGEVARLLGPDGRVFCQTFCRNPRIRSDVDIAVMRRAGHQVFERDQLVGLVGSAGLRVLAEELRGIVQLLAMAPGRQPRRGARSG